MAEVAMGRGKIGWAVAIIFEKIPCDFLFSYKRVTDIFFSLLANSHGRQSQARMLSCRKQAERASDGGPSGFVEASVAASSYIGMCRVSLATRNIGARARLSPMASSRRAPWNQVCTAVLCALVSMPTCSAQVVVTSLSVPLSARSGITRFSNHS